MKRRKDDEKPMGPMFPRLHVNDTEKGGPRAPPRNKMALYEQLSIPSQRFNSGVSPLKPNSNNHVSLSSNQFPPSAPTFQLEKLSRSGSSTMSRVASLANNGGAEDDFAVPVSVQSQLVHGKSTKRKSSEKLTLTDSNNKAQSKRIEGDNVNDPGFDPSQDVRSQTATEPNNCISGSDPESLPKVDGFDKAFEEIKKRKSNKAARLQFENVAREFGPEETLSSRENKVGAPSVRRDPSSGDTQCVNDGQYMSDERSNDGSDASNVDSVSAVDISPDDVVGIIGQKRFWKARKAIVNQQRVFAVQVFELHRLIKVQKLIAASPNLLLEDALALTKPPPSGTTSPAETAAAALEDNENSPSSPSPTLTAKEHPPIQSHQTTEFSAENAVRKPMMAANRSMTPGTPDTWAGGPWGGGASPNPNQWLVPMMSPTEGLVYKPCPGPMFGSCGTSALMGGNLPYLQFGGVPSYPHHQQQQPFFPGGFPHNNSCYFPPYGSMPPMMSMPVPGGSERMNSFSEPVSSVPIGETKHGHPIQQEAATTTGSKRIRRTSREADFQGSTTSSSSSPPMKKVKAALGPDSCDSESGSGNKRRGMFPDGDSCCTSRVIKAVPHNPRSASESVARIFRFIQEERKQ